MSKNLTMSTAGGRIICKQCQATSKRSRLQCKAPAIKGKNVCRNHGGFSTGPRTPEGRERCASARFIHGEETTAIRKQRSQASARLAMLELIGHALGMMTGAQKTRGRKPGAAALDCPDLLHVLAWVKTKPG